MQQVLVCFLVLFAGTLVSAAPSPGTRLVGGKNATKGEYPFMISLTFCVRGSCQHACGGALISPSWIVSAAHCITQMPTQGSYKAIAGVINLDDKSSERQEIRISHAFIVPEYEGGANIHDLAIFKTQNPFTYSDVVQPIKLVSAGVIYDGTGEIVGWGSIGGAVSPIMPNTLQRQEVPILSSDACQSALNALFNKHPFNVDANTCTGPITGDVSTCTGDSGGPLIQNGLLIGVVSWIITPCGTVGAPSVQTKVSHYRNWIATMVDENL